MIRAYLKGYSPKDCNDLYSALHTALTYVSQQSRPAHDIESMLGYIAGYSDALTDSKKGAIECPPV